MPVTPLGRVIKIDRTAASQEECRTLPYVGLEHIEKETGRLVDDYRPRPETLLATKFKFTPRHVLYGKLRPYLNKVVLPTFSGVCTTEILPLLADPAKIERDYLYFLLLSCRFVKWASASVSGANLPRLDPERLLEFEAPVRSLAEQKRIAAVMARADRLRRIRRYALELGDGFLSSAFLRTFLAPGEDFPIFPVGELALEKRGSIRTGPFGSQLLHSEFTDHGIAVLGIDNAVQNRFEWSERRFITPEKYAMLKRYTVFPGDVIITIMGTCGRCAIVPNNIPTAINTKHLCCISLDKAKCLPSYLQACFLHHPSVLKSLGVSEKGAVMPGLNMEIIKELLIPLPPLALRLQFAAIIEKHERLRRVHLEALRQAEHLFQTLLHRAFTTGL